MTVFVRRLEFYAYHGVSDEEQRVGHRFVVDLAAEVTESASITDSIDESVSYAEMAFIAQEIGTGTRYRTVERLANKIATELLNRLPRIQAITISIAKIAPPASIIAAEVGITYRLQR